MIYVGFAGLTSALVLLLNRSSRHYRGAWPGKRLVFLALLALSSLAALPLLLFDPNSASSRQFPLLEYGVGALVCGVLLGLPLSIRAYGRSWPGRRPLVLLAMVALSGVLGLAVVGVLGGMSLAGFANGTAVAVGLGVAGFSMALCAAIAVGLARITASERRCRLGGAVRPATNPTDFPDVLSLLDGAAVIAFVVTLVVTLAVSNTPGQRLEVLRADRVLRCHVSRISPVASATYNYARTLVTVEADSAKAVVTREFSLNGVKLVTAKRTFRRCARASGWQIESGLPGEKHPPVTASKRFPAGWTASLYIDSIGLYNGSTFTGAGIQITLTT